MRGAATLCEIFDAVGSGPEPRRRARQAIAEIVADPARLRERSRRRWEAILRLLTGHDLATMRAHLNGDREVQQAVVAEATRRLEAGAAAQAASEDAARSNRVAPADLLPAAAPPLRKIPPASLWAHGYTPRWAGPLAAAVDAEIRRDHRRSLAAVAGISVAPPLRKSNPVTVARLAAAIAGQAAAGHRWPHEAVRLARTVAQEILVDMLAVADYTCRVAVPGSRIASTLHDALVAAVERAQGAALPADTPGSIVIPLAQRIVLARGDRDVARALYALTDDRLQRLERDQKVEGISAQANTIVTARMWEAARRECPYPQSVDVAFRCPLHGDEISTICACGVTPRTLRPLLMGLASCAAVVQHPRRRDAKEAIDRVAQALDRHLNEVGLDASIDAGCLRDVISAAFAPVGDVAEALRSASALDVPVVDAGTLNAWGADGRLKIARAGIRHATAEEPGAPIRGNTMTALVAPPTQRLPRYRYAAQLPTWDGTAYCILRAILALYVSGQSCEVRGMHQSALDALPEPPAYEPFAVMRWYRACARGMLPALSTGGAAAAALRQLVAH